MHEKISGYAFRISFVLILGNGLGACASATVDADGSTRVTGFVSMRIAPTAPGSAFAGHVTDMRTLGITSYATPSGRGVGIGFMRVLAGFLEDDTLVTGSPYDIR